jgi:hypothetical protein
MDVDDQFEKLIDEGKIQFHKAGLEDLDVWGRALVSTFLRDIPWELGDVKLGASYCLRIDDKLIGYLDVIPETEQFVWCTKDHHGWYSSGCGVRLFVHAGCPWCGGSLHE